MKIRTFTLIALLLLQGLSSFAWAALGAWRSYLSYHNATMCVEVNNTLYVVSNGSLYSYNPKDESINCLDKTNILSDQNIRHMGVCEKSNTLVIIYENANIDLIRSNNHVVNITDYVNAFTLDPKVNDLQIKDGKAYIATNFGATILNIKRGEFEDTYMLGKATNSCVEQNGFIYAATQEGLYRGDTRKNLLDISNWKSFNSGVYTQLTAFDGQLLALKSNDGVYTINPEDGTPTLLRSGSFNFMKCTDETLAIGNKNNVYLYTLLSSSNLLTFDGTVEDFAITEGSYWTCNGTKGLNGYKYDKEGKELTAVATEIIPNSPIRNYCQYLSLVNNDRLLIAGGCLNYYDKTFYNGTLMMYENGTWSFFEEENIAKRTAGHYKNMTCIVQDPKDPNHHFASSFGQGIYEFRDMKFVRQYTHKEKAGLDEVVASPLESAVPSSYQYTRISRLKYDMDGNLWITNADGAGKVRSPLKILKPDGEMIELYYKEIEGMPTMTEVLHDSQNRVWAVSMQNTVRLFCIDLNGTLEDTSDDRVKVFNEKFVDQDGGSIEINYINDITEDHDGAIWVMTDKGPYVLYNTEEAFNSNYHFTKIKVPRNDGTNYADYLLDGTYTTCIEIDPANRKWIGTLNNGLYLIGTDGLEEIHHFTKDETPLPSNTIESLALNQKSGELFIGTDRGLVSYTTDATQPEDTYYEEKVYAFPNPVNYDYDGSISIVGLKQNSHVKIINTAGRLVAEGTSLGGTFTWDGRTPQGQRVPTGIYYVLGSDEEGNEGIVTKVLFIK